jgi:hypothetical protein
MDELYQLAQSHSINTQLILIPLSMSFAIFHSRLWEIDSIINRTLVYGALTACVIIFYVLVVGRLGLMFQALGTTIS